MANYIESIDGLEYCIVIEAGDCGNYAVAMSHDGTMVACEHVANATGVYSLDMSKRINDQNIVDSVNSFYTSQINADLNMGNVSIEHFIAFAIKKAYQQDVFRKIHGLPKMTKSLAKSLSSIQELMVLGDFGNDDIEHMCFGYRKKIAEFFDTQGTAIYCSPERFYTVACFETRFNPSLYAYYNNYVMLVVADPEKLDKIGILATYDWSEHMGWLEKRLME